MKVIVIMLALFTAMANAATGVGYDGTLGGVSGASVVTSVTDRLSAQSIVGYNLVSVDGKNYHTYGIGLRGWYLLKQVDQVSLLTGFGVSISDLDSNNELDEMRYEIPFGIDYQFSPHFSVAGQTGIVAQLDDNLIVDVFQVNGTMFLGAFAFHYWF